MEAAVGVSPEREPLLIGRSSEGPEPNYQSTSGDAAADRRITQDEDSPETPRRRASLGERQQFQASRQEVLRDAAANTQSWRSPLGAFFFILGCTLLLIPPVIIIYIEVRSWHVLVAYGHKPCDQDLVFWLIIRNVMFLTAPQMPSAGDPDAERAERQRRAVQWSSTLWLAWLVVGYVWTSSCKTCQQTNPELFDWVRFLTIFSLLVHLLKIFFPLLFLLAAMAYHAMVARGWLKSPNAASEVAIENMPKVEFREGFFGVTGEGAAPAECCCCMDEFGPQKTIVRTPCAHYYHYDCLKEWLKMAKTCPLCRKDLDEEQPASSSA